MCACVSCAGWPYWRMQRGTSSVAHHHPSHHVHTSRAHAPDTHTHTHTRARAHTHTRARAQNHTRNLLLHLHGSAVDALKRLLSTRITSALPEYFTTLTSPASRRLFLKLIFDPGFRRSVPMATSDGLDSCLLQRGRSQSDPNILTESAIDLVHAAGKSLEFCY